MILEGKVEENTWNAFDIVLLTIFQVLQKYDKIN